MELRDYFRVLRKSWLAILLCTLVGVSAAAAYSLTRTPLYSASSTVVVSTQGGNTVGELQQGSNFTQSRVQTYTQLVTTPIVMNPVIDELGLGVTAEKLAGSVSASAGVGTFLVTITVTDPDPVQAADIANALGESLTQSVAQIEPPNSAGDSPVRLTRVRDAIPAGSPSTPNTTLNIALGALVGFAAGIAVAVLRRVLDTKIRTGTELAEIADAPLVGAIAYDPKARERPIIVQHDPRSPRAESFRTLRTNLQFIDIEKRSSFVVTSSIPSEGKSTTVINLAIALADAGIRVALIDADLRLPKVAEYLNIEGAAGLTDLLIGRAELDDLLQQWGNRSLWVLPAGRIPPNPSELLGSPSMFRLLERLQREYDIVLCDAPPLLPVTDAAVLAKQTSGAIVIAAAGRTVRHQFATAIDALETIGAKVAGVVLTMAPTKGPDSYYGYTYGYGGYGVLPSEDATATTEPVEAAEPLTDREDTGYLTDFGDLFESDLDENNRRVRRTSSPPDDIWPAPTPPRS